jgi:hypothetical protein
MVTPVTVLSLTRNDWLCDKVRRILSSWLILICLNLIGNLVAYISRGLISINFKGRAVREAVAAIEMV